MSALQVLSTCPDCRVESAVLELIDPDAQVSFEGHCRLCGYRTEGGSVAQRGRRFAEATEVLEALHVWSRSDGEPDVAVFVATNMGNLKPQQVAARVLAGEHVETSFDVIAYLFPQAASGTSFQPDDRKPEIRVVNAVQTVPMPETAPDWAPLPRSARDLSRALVSVMLADGVVRAEEKAALERLSRELQAPALEPHEMRVWRPQELAIPENPERVIAAMKQMLLADREADATEVRVLDEYARHWGVKLDRGALSQPGTIGGLVNAVVRLFVR